MGNVCCAPQESIIEHSNTEETTDEVKKGGINNK